MKRAVALQPLSHDHHDALVQAASLRRAVPADAAAALTAFLDFWRDHASAHFRVEEEVLLPAYARRGDPAHPAVIRTLVEHVEIRRDVAELARLGAPAGPALLRAIGDRLGGHVRYEERVLFPLVEATLAEQELAELGEAVKAAERALRGA